MLSELDPGTLKPKQETSQMDFKQILEKARKYAADSKNDKKRADKMNKWYIRLVMVFVR